MSSSFNWKPGFFRCLIPSGKDTNRKRWVDQEVNIAILPFGLFCSGKTISSSFSGNTGFSLPHTFW